MFFVFVILLHMSHCQKDPCIYVEDTQREQFLATGSRFLHSSTHIDEFMQEMLIVCSCQSPRLEKKKPASESGLCDTSKLVFAMRAALVSNLYLYP